MIYDEHPMPCRDIFTMTEFQSDFEFSEFSKETQIIPSSTPSNILYYYASLGGHQIKAITSGIYSLVTRGVGRPSWNYTLHFFVHYLRSNLEFESHTMHFSRHGIATLTQLSTRLPSWSSSHPQVRINQIQLKIHKKEIYKLEQLGKVYHSQSKTHMYPVPNEVDHNEYTLIDGEWINPPEEKRRDKVILYLHGGAYMLGNALTFRPITTKLAKETGYSVFVINYRLAPEHPMPAALHDALSAYIWLLNPNHALFNGMDSNRPKSYLPQDIILGGDSAGGGLALSLLNYIDSYLKHPNGSPMVPFPSCAFIYSPWLDLSFSSNSCRLNTQYDYLPRNLYNIHSPILPNMHHPVYMYILGEKLNRSLPTLKHERQADKDATHSDSDLGNYAQEKVTAWVGHPLISPLFYPDFHGFPPLFIVAGECELLADESIALANKYRNCNKNNEQSWIHHELYKDMVHDFMIAIGLQSSLIGFQNTIEFLNIVDQNKKYTEFNQIGLEYLV